MLKDCLEIFNEEMKRAKEKTGEEERLILDRYIPKDGDYLIVGENGEIRSHTIIKLDRKIGRLEQSPPPELLFYDYHSSLINTDKAVDSKKTIHSNNYYSFFVQWDSLENGKLDEEAIDRYFDALKEPEKKYKNKDRKMYVYVAEQLEEIEETVLESHREWIKKHIFSLDKTGMSEKNYLKIFFEAEKESYLNEDKRYLMTKLYNKNEYNILVKNQILGLPNDNLGLNAKKPYLEHKTRKMAVPYLVSPEEALRQKLFFDYLMNFANAGMNDIFFDYGEQKVYPQKRGEIPSKDFSGYFLQIRKTKKELQIIHQDVVVDFRCKLKKKFVYRNVLQLEDKEERYKNYRSKEELQNVLHEILFSKYLKQNYFTPQEDIPVDGKLKKTLLWSRGSIFSWVYNGKEDGMKHIMHMVCRDMLQNSIQNGYTAKMGQQFNLMCSLDEYFGGENMEETYQVIRGKLREKINSKEEYDIESDAEFAYAAGQLVNYFISLSKTNEKKHSLANPFFSITDGEMMKKKLNQYFIKYDYAIDKTKAVRFNRLYSMVLHYDMNGKIIQENIIAGYISNSLIYESNKQNTEEGK